MLVSSTESAIVTGRRDAYAGIITVQTVMEAISAANAPPGRTTRHRWA
ncbi:hypothetical protein [Arthrobacter sp. JCM 19049]|nr:hypothetical protein [Arthrobacter sp. JCM 19049]